MRKIAYLALVVAAMAAGNVSAQQPALTKGHVQELLFDAASAGRTDMIDTMAKAGADVNAYDPRGFTPLILAAYNGHLDTVEALIAARADACKPDATQGNTAQMGVAFKGNDAVAARLIAAGCDPNARNRQGQTALMMAAMFNRTAQIDMLKAAGAQADIVDDKGRTAASVARDQGNDAAAASVTN